MRGEGEERVNIRLFFFFFSFLGKVIEVYSFLAKREERKDGDEIHLNKELDLERLERWDGEK